MNKKNTYTILFASLALATSVATVSAQDAATATVSGTSVANQTEIKALRTELDTLKAKREELRAQVASGAITKESAKAEWETLISTFRTKKQVTFDAHIEKMTNRFKGLAEKDPELAGKIESKVNALKDRRETMKVKRDDIRTQVKAGTITREQANTERKAAFASTTTRVKEARKELQATRTDRREDRQDRQEDKRGAKVTPPPAPIQ